MKLDANSFNIVDGSDLNTIYDIANKYYMSKELDRRLSSSQQVARAYVEAVLSVLVTNGTVSLNVKGKEQATDLSSIESD